MAEGGATELLNTEGQTAEGTQGIESTQAAPEGGTEQSAEGTETGTTQADPGISTEETFFDPRDIEGKPELEAAYKSMQGAFTKRMQAISGEREKLEAYDAFMQNPLAAMTEVAKQHGYQLTREGEQPQGQDNEPWEPQSWDEVTSKTTNAAVEAVKEFLQPLMGEFQGMKKTAIEKQLSEIDPTWQQYEDDMKASLAAHPTLAKDPAALYRMSVPEKVLQGRAMKEALRKFEDKAKASQVSGSSTTTKKPGVEMPDKSLSFQESVALAKKKLAEEGIRPPGT